MQAAKPEMSARADYVEAYGKAMQDVIAACGSKETANRLMDDLSGHYVKTERDLRALERRYGSDSENLRKEKDRRLQVAKYEVHKIVEKYVPHASWHLEELIMGTSLAVTATLIAPSQAASTLIAATSIVAIGGSYYIGFKLLKNWSVIASKHRLADFSGRNVPSFGFPGRAGPARKATPGRPGRGMPKFRLTKRKS